MSDDPIAAAFRALEIEPPEDDLICIYKSGTVDSAELMQVLLEIELETDVQLDLASLMEGDVTLARLRETLAEAT